MGKDSRAVRLSVAALAALAAMAVRLAFGDATDPTAWYLCFIVFVVFSAWYGGLKPGLITTALLAAAEWFTLPARTAAAHSSEELHLLLFLLAGSAVSAAMQSVRKERRKAELAETRVRGVLESTHDAIVSVDPEFRITYANKAAGRIAKKQPSDLKGRSLRTVFPETPNVVLYRELTHALLESAHKRFEDGSQQSHRWYEFNVYPAPGGLTIFFSDMTAEKKIEIERARVTAEPKPDRTKVEAVLRQLPVGVVIVNAALQVEMANPAAMDIFGQKLLRGERFDEPGGPDRSPISIAVRTGVAVSNFEFEHTTPDGQHRTLLANCLPVQGSSGQVTGVIGTYSDVTSVRHIERQLSMSEARLQRLFESPFIGVVAGSGVRFIDANDAFLNMIGYSREDLADGLTWTSITPSGFEDADERALRQLAEAGFCDPFEKEYVRKDGELISVLLVVASYGPGDAASWVAWALDLSERRRLEKRLRDAARLESIGLLAGGVAHDFNNILTGVLGNASMALELLAPAHSARKLVENAIHSAERASELTRQLLAYAGKGQFIVEPVDLARLLRDTSRLIRTSVPRSVELELDLPPRLHAVEADAVQLQQVVMNLVINAAEAVGDGGGTVRISASEASIDEAWIRSADVELAPGSYVSFEVQDTGCGMDETTLRSIFDPFFTTKFTGRGLGLAAAIGIARAHKGAIKVYSAPGVGSTFRVLLPALASGISAPDEPGKIEAGPPLRGSGTILVVDDEDVVRRVAKTALERSGYTVLVAPNGRQALEIYRGLSHSISMVLLDMTMPLMGGEEALRNLKAFNPAVKVLLTSGFNEPDSLRRVEGHAAGFIQKPYSADALVRRVYEIINTAAAAG